MKRVLVEVVDPAVVLGAVVATDAIAGSCGYAHSLRYFPITHRTGKLLNVLNYVLHVPEVIKTGTRLKERMR
jgi:hypothetical protein